MPHHEYLVEIARSVIPVLDKTLHKGSSGKIGILGGFGIYTGAPFYSAMGALRTGADLVHVFCDQQNSHTIRSYSPELIVHPVDLANLETLQWIRRMHVLVIGPGLTRDPAVIEWTCRVVQEVEDLDMGIVLDADGLELIEMHPGLFSNRHLVVITPNRNELERLYSKLSVSNLSGLSELLGSLTGIVSKGEQDHVLIGSMRVECGDLGCYRRCGGQGDVLSGVIATFLSWVRQSHLETEELQETLLGIAWGSCKLVREAALVGFRKRGRSMSAIDVIFELGNSFSRLFG